MAVFAIATPLIGGTPFAVVADEDGAHYVYPTGQENGGADADRITAILETLEIEAPTDPAEWLGVALYGYSMFTVAEPIEAGSLEEAFLAAQALLDGMAGQSNRDALMEDIDDAHFDFVMNSAPVFDAARSSTSPDYNIHHVDIDADPEDELGFQLQIIGEINPTEPHRWLPLTLSEQECAFCDLLEDAPVHASL